jgi:hypothetical protein
LEPGGCSATPISLRTRFTIAWPAELAGAGVPVREAALADCSWATKLELLAVAVAATGVVEAVGAGACVTAGATSMLCSCATRERATSKLMHRSHRLSVQRALAVTNRRTASHHYTRAS